MKLTNEVRYVTCWRDLRGSTAPGSFKLGSLKQYVPASFMPVCATPHHTYTYTCQATWCIQCATSCIQIHICLATRCIDSQTCISCIQKLVLTFISEFVHAWSLNLCMYTRKTGACCHHAPACPPYSAHLLCDDGERERAREREIEKEREIEREIERESHTLLHKRCVALRNESKQEKRTAFIFVPFNHGAHYTPNIFFIIPLWLGDKRRGGPV